MTFNPDEKGDADGIANVITDAVGDSAGIAGVAGLQELCKDERNKVIEGLRGKSDRTWHSVYMLNDRGGGRPPWVCENGNAIVTTQPLRGIGLVPFHAQSDDDRDNDETRGYVHASIRVHGVAIRVYSTHLTGGGEHQAVRRKQINQLIRDINRENFRGPRVVLGDFNATPEAPEMAPLYRLFKNVGPATPTTSSSIGPCPPQGERPAKIDHIFVSRSIEVSGAYVPSLADDENPSDGHCPVVADLRVRRE
ncbi:endonuclease/exonuclease/phosphatase family protein [Nonomuraea sp. NPDC048892]|uniref:endonuclease/exonuclease/phosphatase family protein n=1 Tax=Nonomuraea sp. NPDC048892 TaxID=3154624 RepID=UPI0033F527FC